MLKTARVVRTRFQGGRRILAMSDLHATPHLFHDLLGQLDFCREDILVLVGDLLEKGADSLRLLRDVMALSREYEVHTLCGNCDDLVREFVDQDGFLSNGFYRFYLTRYPNSAIWQMAREGGCTDTDLSDRGLDRLRRTVAEHCPEELDFLRSLPHILETERLLFVHGGVPSTEGMDRMSAWHVMKNDSFMTQDRRFEKYCIVGHWPVTLYDAHIQSSRPRIDRERRIISIDGGCGLTVDGQLNALVIPDEREARFYWAACDGLERVTALDRQEPSADSVNVRWGIDNRLELLEQGEEFSLCRHVDTGRELHILNRFLFDSPEGLRCGDATDYRLDVQPGDELALVVRTGRAILAKKHGVTGWYHGRYAPCGNGRDHAELSPLD